MALDKTHTVDMVGLAIQASEIQNAAGTVILSGTQGAAVAALTDSTGGATGNNTMAAIVTQTAITDNAAGVAADGTIAAITDVATAGGVAPSATQVDTAVNGALVLVRDAVKELSTTANLHTTAINTIRDDLADLGAKINALRASLMTAGVIA